MFEVFGPVARPVPGLLPLGLALLPLVGAAAFGDARRARLRALVALGVGAIVALGFFAWSFRWAPEQRFVLANLGVAARVGQLDLVLALGLDPLGAIASVAVSLVAARLVWAQRGVSVSRRRIGLSCAMASAMQLVVLADGAATLALAFGVAALVGGALGYVHVAHFVADRVADVALVGAAAVLFWVLGGSWIDGQYVPELEPRLVVASADAHAKPAPLDDDDEDERTAPVPRGALSSLSFGGLPGAYVLLDGAWLRDARKRVVVAPFADVPIAAGAHTIRLRVGAGSDDFFIPKLDAPPNQPVTLAERGATTTFRAIADDLVMRDVDGSAAGGTSQTRADGSAAGGTATPAAEALARRKFFGGASAAGIVLALLALGLVARARAVPFAPSIDEPARALAALGAVVTIARFPIASTVPHAAATVASALAIASLVASTVALRNDRASALLTGEIALAGAGAIAGAPALAVVHATVACLVLAREKETSPLALVGLLPTRAAFAGACVALPFGAVPAAIVLAASWVGSCALARRARARAPLAAVGAVVAFAVAFDPRTFGSALGPLASRGLAASFRAAPAAPAPSLAILALTAALVAFAFAASRTGALATMARSPAAGFAVRASAAPARAAGALARAIASALVELEARGAALVRAGDSVVRGVGSLASAVDGAALVSPTKHARFALPPDRALRWILVPVALVAAALFAVPWAS